MPADTQATGQPSSTSPEGGSAVPGSLTMAQWLAILLAYSGLGRAPMLVISERAGRPVDSVMDLSGQEAERVLAWPNT